MRYRNDLTLAAAALSTCAAAISGCNTDVTDWQVGGVQLAVELGQPESQYPAVGSLTSIDFPTGYCTGAVVDPNWVLTAGHCGLAPEFRVGTSKTDFVSYPVDDRIRAPGIRDMALLHLAKPVPVSSSGQEATERLQQLKANPGMPPIAATGCTSVGFGLHQEDDGHYTKDAKRSASVKVVSADADLIVVEKDTGITDHHDSGGPLICNGTIAGVVKTHGNASWPDYSQATYTTVDAKWITDTIANYHGPAPALQTLKPIFHLGDYTGTLCPAGSLTLHDSTIVAADGGSFVRSSGEPLTCTMQIELELPAGKVLSQGNVYPNFELRDDAAQAEVSVTYTLPDNVRSVTAKVGEERVFDGIGRTLQLRAASCDTTRVPLRIDVNAGVASGQELRMISLAHDFSQADGALWSDCGATEQPVDTEQPEPQEAP